MSSSKRKSTVTLHDFFNAGGGSSISVKAKRKATVQCKSLVTPKDIIVIDDSDSEPEMVQVIPSTKKCRRSNSSGEVEFVEKFVESNVKSCVPHNITSSRYNGETEDNGLKQRSLIPIDFTVSSRSNSAILKNEETLTFGTPSLLLDPGSSATFTEEPSPDILSFGKPILLLQNDGTTSFSNQGASTSHPVIPKTKCQTPQTPDESLYPPPVVGDDWGTGDDEIIFVSVPDEDEEAEDSTMMSPNDEEDIKCPSCDMLLNGLSHLVSTRIISNRHRDKLSQELARHVNDCLDSRGSSAVEFPSMAKSVGRTEVKPLQPLSSLAPPEFEGHLPSRNSNEDTKPSSPNSNVFSVLMSSHKENEAWKEATVAEKRDFRPNKNGGRRKAPFYKVMQGMPIAVDAFRYGTIPGVTAYFLTHAHSDHYTNLASNWKSGPIYCSEGTANLIVHMLAVDKTWVYPLPYGVPTEVPNTGGVHVTLIEANHCPGSCLFFFEGRQTVNAGDSAFESPFVGSSKIFRYLHCGDFRASPRHVLHPLVNGKRIDHVYLDTTYLDPKYTFPPQPLVISACAELSRRLVAGEPLGHTSTAMDKWAISKNIGNQSETERWLIVVGTYSIGKERIVKAIAHAVNSKVYCDSRKAAILRCQADAELNALLTSDPLEATVHLVPLGTITSDRLKAYIERFKGKFSKAAGFRPTGWTYTPPTGTNELPTIASIVSHPHRGFNHTSLRPARQSTAALQLFPVPYSEHSSFFELTCFAMSFDWGKMIATVNVGSENSRGKMAKWVGRWEAERKKRGKDEIVPYRHIDYW
ncbi:DNA cross-link repair protein pso2/snm1 [Termitomyces sp. T112]|nr:DNA cross-link repair protein pso2/snm1 [Termitomyces sp. T112]